MTVPAPQPVYRGIIGICLAGSLAMYLLFLNSFYRVSRICLKRPQTVIKAAVKSPAVDFRVAIVLNAEMLFNFIL
jgi:hypothetical protein